MSQSQVIPVSPGFSLTPEAYAQMRERAARDPDGFFGEAARRLDWMRAPTEVRDVSYDEADFRIRWFGDGIINVAANCIDRHLATRGDQTAIIWEGDEPGQSRAITYRELHREVCRMANVLKAHGVRRGSCRLGDRGRKKTN